MNSSQNVNTNTIVNDLQEQSLISLVSNKSITNQEYDALASVSQRTYNQIKSNQEIKTLSRQKFSKLVSKFASKEKNQQISSVSNLLQQPNNIQLCFLVDCTGSMNPYIKAVKQNIISIVNSYSHDNIQIAFVGYRDYDPTDYSHIHTLNFTNDVTRFYNYLDDLKAGGGDDLPEDVLGGLKSVTDLNWRVENTNIMYHIADFCGHNKKWHSTKDRFPDGHPKDLPLDYLLQKIKDLHIDYYFGRITKHTDLMITDFEKILNKKIVIHDISNPETVKQTVKSSIDRSLNLRSTISTNYNYDSHYSIKSITNKISSLMFGSDTLSDTTITNNKLGTIYEEVDFDNIPIQDCFIIVLDEFKSLDEIINYKQKEHFTYDGKLQVSNNIIGKGGCRIAFDGRQYYKENNAVEDVVLKQHIRSSQSDELVKIEYLQDQETQTVTKFLANMFNKQFRLKTKIKVVRAKIIQIANSTTYYALEKKITKNNIEDPDDPEWLKFNTNAGHVVDLPHIDQQLVKIAAAFSHYTYHITNGYLMVVDLQGIIYKNNIILTDPAIHCKEAYRFGGTNLSTEGFKLFFNTHKCNSLCRDFIKC
jgi:hypothetical protein